MEGHTLNPAKCVAFFSSLVAIGFLIGFTVMLATYQPTKSCPTRSPCPTNTDVNLPEYSENEIVIEDATTSITISDIFTQPESINSKPGRTIIPVEPEVVIDAIDPHQVEKDERTKNLTKILNSRKIDLDVNATTMEMLKALQDEGIKGNCTSCEENLKSDFVRSNSTSLSTYVIPFITEEKVPEVVKMISTASSNTTNKPFINSEQVDNVDAIDEMIKRLNYYYYYNTSSNKNIELERTIIWTIISLNKDKEKLEEIFNANITSHQLNILNDYETIKKPLIKGSFNGEQVDNVIVDATELQIDQQIIKNQTLEKSSLETVLTEKIEVLNLSNQASEEIRPHDKVITKEEVITDAEIESSGVVAGLNPTNPTKPLQRSNIPITESSVDAHLNAHKVDVVVTVDTNDPKTQQKIDNLNSEKNNLESKLEICSKENTVVTNLVSSWNEEWKLPKLGPNV
jgi:hypothetical protein